MQSTYVCEDVASRYAMLHVNVTVTVTLRLEDRNWL